jgi:hypothetical protein
MLRFWRFWYWRRRWNPAGMRWRALAFRRKRCRCGLGFFASAALVLFVYGVTVNLPPWDFGKLLGVYVALFFVVAQIINLFAFGMKPSLPIYCGGALIVAGGMLMTFWKV